MCQDDSANTKLVSMCVLVSIPLYLMFCFCPSLTCIPQITAVMPMFSTHSFIQRQASELNIKTACVTFDQPLWLRAVEIIASNSLYIVYRLGGFHMFYLGSIGTVMSGSGFSDAIGMCYSPKAVIHMLSGKAFHRALRGYLLVDAAITARLMSLVIPECSCSADGNTASIDGMSDHMDVVFVKQLISAFASVWSNDCDSECMAVVDEAVVKLSTCLAQLKSKLICEFRTAKLWLQYLLRLRQ